MCIVAKGLVESVKEPKRSDSCTCVCRGVGKRGAGAGGREDERVVDDMVVGSMRRIEGGRTTLSATNEIMRTYVSKVVHISGGSHGEVRTGLTNNSSIKEAEK